MFHAVSSYIFYMIPYSTLSSPPKRPTLSQISEGTRQRWFLFFKKFSKFSKILQHLYQKSNWVVFWLLRVSIKIGKPKKKEVLFYRKFKGIVFYIKFFVENFSKAKILPNSQEGLDKGVTGQLWIRYILLRINVYL